MEIAQMAPDDTPARRTSSASEDPYDNWQSRDVSNYEALPIGKAKEA
jgi:hypothetical protein